VTADTEVENIIREFQKHRQRLLSYIRSLTCDAEKADDIVQEVAVIVLRKANAGERPHNLPGWCVGIARKVLLRQRESDRRLIYIDNDEWISLVDRAFEENAAEFDESLRARLRQCVAKLSAQARELLELRYTRSLRVKEIAQQARRTELSVNVTLCRLRKSLRECMERGSAGAEVAE